MSSAADTATLDSPDLRRRDWLTILLIGIAHASSHFFQLVLPSLYVSLGTAFDLDFARLGLLVRSEEHTSELQSLMRISYAVFCLKKTINHNMNYTYPTC